MSIKRFLIILLLIAVLLSLILFAAISQNYIDNYFNNYIDEEYMKNVDNLSEYARLVITEGHQPRSVLNSYIIDPIYYAEIKNADGDTVSFSGMMHNNFEFDSDTMTVDSYDVYEGDKIIGELLITRENNTSDTLTYKLFHNALLIGAGLSILITMLGIGVVSYFLIRFISKNVDKVVKYATNDEEEFKCFRIKELKTIMEAISNYRVMLLEKEKVKKQKFDRLLHETKTPITILKSQLEGISDGVVEMDKDSVNSMLEAVDNLDNMLKNITGIVEGVPDEEEIVISEIDYSIELEKLVKSLSEKFNKKGIELMLKSEEFRIKTNKELLNQAVYNLLINSYKYTKKGKVVITSNSIDNTINIKDTGIGIDREDLQYIFKPYYRGKNVEKINGEGLGLSIAKDNIEKAGGRISVKSEINKFTEYIISF